MKTVAID